MAIPGYDLIAAVRQALLADPTVTGYIEMRFYDPPPQADASVVTPWISLGPTTYVRADADCIHATEVSFQLDVWTQGAGEAHSSVQCRKICDAIVDVLHDAELNLANSALASLQLGLAQIMRDPDGIHNHGVLRFDAVVEETQ